MSHRKQQPRSLREWREQRGFTFQQAADYIGIPLTTYFNVERGGMPRRELLKKIKDRTGLSADVLTQVA